MLVSYKSYTKMEGQQNIEITVKFSFQQSNPYSYSNMQTASSLP